MGGGQLVHGQVEVLLPLRSERKPPGNGELIQSSPRRLCQGLFPAVDQG